MPSFKAISKELKAILKHTKEGENISLKNKALFGEWFSLAGKACRPDKFIKGKDLSQRFDDWIYRECGIKKQTIYNYRHLFKLLNVAPKLLGCRANMMYFVKNHDILITHLENEGQIPWKHHFNCNFCFLKNKCKSI